ncbi:MAG: ABC transporter ATP-binding protein [Peptococcaceae bacterium]|nr:ABC transporter ATP-binding protein [Peptococcaceae bacterium]
MESLVQTKGLSLYYNKVMGALKDINLAIPSGRIVGLVGPNGSGKTTLLKVLAGLLNVYTGDVKIDGHPISVESKSAVSYLPEKTYLADWMKPIDAIEMFADFYEDFDQDKALELMDRFSLTPQQPLKNMSKGMQEKVQVILVMSRRAKLYLLDEPLGGIDPAARSVMLDIILENYSREASVIVSTHLLHDIEQIFDDVIFMDQGAVRLQDQVDQIRQSSGKSLEDVFKEVYR